MENDMSNNGNMFAFRFWAILGFIAGVIVAVYIALEGGYSILLSVLCAIGGGLAGAILLIAFMALYYMMYRMDIFSRK
jgi:hypothetical protein